MKNNNLLLGVLWILVNNLVMCIQSATIKWLFGGLHSFQIIFLYKLTVFILAAIFVLYRGIGLLKTKKLPLYFLRAFLSIAAATVFVHGLEHIELANAVAIGFTEPLFATVLAIFLLKEQLNKYCLRALIIGFLGVIIMLRPNAANFNYASLYVLLAALIWSLDNIVIKLLGRTEGSISYLFYISLFSTLFSLPLAVREWQNPTLVQLPWIFALAILYFIHLIAMFKAFQYAKLSNLAPCDFSRLMFSTMIGYVVFHEKIDSWVIIGSAIIISSSVYIVWHREKEKSKIKAAAKVSVTL